MLTIYEYPILEFDDNKTAKLNPTHFVGNRVSTNKLVITFFLEVIEKLKEEGKIFLERTIGGENLIQMYQFVDSDVLITLGFVGCPSCAGNLDLFTLKRKNLLIQCKKLLQTIVFFTSLNIIRINRTQHASQRCGPRWVF